MADRVATYARVSTDSQRVQPQACALAFHCRQEGSEVVAEYLDDGVSGTARFQARPAGARLLEDAASGKFDVVFVSRVDRWARDPAVALEAADALARHGVTLHFVEEPLDVTARTGRDELARRAQKAADDHRAQRRSCGAGIQRARRAGRWLGGGVRFGHREIGRAHV